MTQPFRTFVKNFGVFVAAVLAVLGWAITSGWTAVDHRYVHADSFAVFQSALASDRRQDSTVHAAEFNELKGLMLRMDTTLRVCVQHRDTCR